MTTIRINGEERDVPDGLTLSMLLDWLKLPADRVAVEHNLKIVSRNRWRETPIQTGDRLEVVHFVGGGAASVLLERGERFSCLMRVATSGRFQSHQTFVKIG